MPSASAKLEKQASTEACDPMKQVLSMVEKKVRNLEKRKGKLDGYKADSNSGKELNEDQLNAVKKYEQVVEVLEFSKEMQKAVQVIHVDCLKMQKKAAKRELVEKQQQEMQKLRELLLLQDLLNNMGTDDTRQDFLNQTNGAVKLSETELNNLDELYKLVSPDRSPDANPDGPPFQEQLSAAAEHLVLLLEGRTKEILGTNYKTLKETLLKIEASGYFNSSNSGALVEEEEVPVEVVQEVVETELVAAAEDAFQAPQEELNTVVADDLASTQQQPQVEGVFYGAKSGAVYVASGAQTQQPPQQPLTDVLHGQAPINFLQDSQVDLESPHMDPAVVVAHPMAPPPASLGYHTNPFGSVAAVQQTLGDAQSPTFDPIPTQTFTNQNFANLPNIVGAPASSFIPATLPGPVNPMGLVHPSVVPQQPQPPQLQQQQPPPQQQALRTSPDMSAPKQDSYIKSDFQTNINSAEKEPGHYHSSDENEAENSDGFQVQQSSYNNRQQGYNNRGGRGGPRGTMRGGGTSNGYGGGRGRANYSNNNGGGRGAYQGGSNYYGNREYNNNGNRDFNGTNQRRGTGQTPRGPGSRGGAPRGDRGGSQQPGGARGAPPAGGYRSQPQQ